MSETYEVKWRDGNGDDHTERVDNVMDTVIDNNTMIFLGAAGVVWWIDLREMRSALVIDRAVPA